MFLEKLTAEILNEKFNEKSGSTSTENKVDNIEPVIFKIVYNVAYAKPDEYAITLVGPADGLKRHLEEFRSVGIPDYRLIIVERDPGIYKQLSDAKIENNYGFTLINEDFLKALQMYIAKGYKFNFVDFDGTDGFDEYHFKLIDYFIENKNKIKCLRIVARPRLPSEFGGTILDSVAKNLKLSKGIYYPEGRMDALHAIQNNIKNLERKLPEQYINELYNKINSALKSKNFKVNVLNVIPDDVILSEYVYYRNKVNTLTGAYKGKGTMSNIFMSYTDLTPYKSSSLSIGTDFLKLKTKQVNIWGNNITVYDVKRGGEFQKALANDTGYYLINNVIYHIKYGELAKL